jgi:integrase
MAAGIRQRHGLRCNGKGRCSCPWEASVYSKHDGKKIRRTFPTKAAAVGWRDDSRSAVRRQLMRAPTSETHEAAEAWLEGARAGIIRPRSGEPYKPSAIRNYDQGLRLRVLPELGSRKLAEITQADLQDFVDTLQAQGVSGATIEATVIPLRAVYRRAVKRPESGIAINPTTGLELPIARGKRDRIAPPEECAKLLDALPAKLRPLWATAMYAGLRRGEMMALRIEDVDLGAGLIHVRRGWDRYAGEISPKSGVGRTVPIAAALRDHLDEHLLGLNWQEGLVFGVSAVSPFMIATVIYQADKAWAKAGLRRITMHECRHTFASLMIAAGVNAKALSTYMGHANIGITLDRYGHLMPGNEEEAAGLLDAYLSQADSRARLAPVSRQFCPDSAGFERTPAE